MRKLKKTMAFVLALVMAVNVFLGTDMTIKADAATKVVYFDNAKTKWSTVCAYTWGGSEGALTIKGTKVEGNIYKMNISDDCPKILFKNTESGWDKQTANTTVQADDKNCFKPSSSANKTSGTWYHYEEAGVVVTDTVAPTTEPTNYVTVEPTENVVTTEPTAVVTQTPVVNTSVVYYKRATNSTWNNAYAHYNVNGVWTVAPGVAMEKLSAGYWKITIDLGDSEEALMCFNNGSGTWDTNNSKKYTVYAGTYLVDQVQKTVTKMNVSVTNEPINTPILTSNPETVAPTVKPTKTPKPATATPKPTKTPRPATATPTVKPTRTPKPATATPKPTKTPRPATATPTVKPTKTPRPATATPQPTNTPEPVITEELSSDWEYYTSGKYVYIYCYSGDEKELLVKNAYLVDGKGYKTVIPSTKDEYLLLAENSQVEVVTFEDGVTFQNNCMYQTFKGCSSIKTVNNIPNTVTNMNQTFFGCTSMVIPPVIPENVWCASDCFGQCTSLTKTANHPDSLSDTSCMYEGCVNLKEIDTCIPENVTRCSYMFRNIPNLQATIEFKAIFEPESIEDLIIYGGVFEEKNLTTLFSESATSDDAYIRLVDYTAGPQITCIVKEALENGTHIELGPVKNPCGPLEGEYTLDDENKTITFSLLSADIYCAVIYDKYVVDGIVYDTVLKSRAEQQESIFDVCKYYTGSSFSNLNYAYICENVEMDNVDYLFANCDNLCAASVCCKNVKTMSYTFYNCSSFFRIDNMPEGVIQMNHTFERCKQLKEVVGWKFPNTVERMDYCFFCCDSLELFDCKLPENLISNEGMFDMCDNLKNYNINFR